MSQVDELIRTHMGLAKKMAARVPDQRMREDAYSDALLGLVEAAQHFDPSRGFKFATFAVHRIRGAIGDGYRARHGRRERRKPKAIPFSPERHDFVDANAGEQLDAVCERMSAKQTVTKVLDRLDAQQRARVIAYYYEGMPLKAIGERDGCTESAVSQGLTRARALMRADLGETA